MLAAFEAALTEFLLERYASESFTELTAGVLSRAAIGAVRAAAGVRRGRLSGKLDLDRAFEVLRRME